MESTGAGRVDRVETHYEITADLRRREVAALTRWQLARQSAWAAHRRRWTRLAAGGLLVAAGLLLVPGVPVLLAACVPVGVGFVVGLDLALRPRRVRAAFTRALAAMDPVGTPVDTCVTPDAIEVTLPGSAHRIATTSVTRATWADDVLVLDTSGTRFYALPGEALSDEAWAVLRPVLADRLVDAG